jgi:Holliday junction resolvasome RuvABC endonuclease subunit
MYFLSLDQSLTNTGVAYIKCSESGELESIKIDTIVTTKLDKTNIGIRLNYISDEIEKFILKNPVNYCFIEGIFSHLNVSTLISLSKVQGIIECTFTKLGYKYNTISPREWQVYFELTKIKDKQKSVQYIMNTSEIYSKIINKSEINQHNADAILIGLFGIKQYLK